MITQVSSSLQDMINSVRSDIRTGVVQPPMAGQFTSIYPSPKEMVMNTGVYGYPIMPPAPQPMYGYPGYTAYGYPIPNPPGPMMGEYRSNIPPSASITDPSVPITYNEYSQPEPGKPKPGRAIPVQTSVPEYAQLVNDRIQKINEFASTRKHQYVGGLYPNRNDLPNPYSEYLKSRQQPIKYQPPDIKGAVDVYDGIPVHPHSNPNWYGTPTVPFTQYSKQVLDNGVNMKNAFDRAFPQYSIPLANPFGSPSLVRQIPREVQDMANIAAFHGMTYNQFIENGSKIMKRLCKVCGTYLGKSDEEVASMQKTYDVKSYRGIMDKPNSDTDLYYPPWAFDFRGQLTLEYQDVYCTTDRIKEAVKKLKVVANNGRDGEVECKQQRRIDFIQRKNLIERAYIMDAKYHEWLQWNRVRCANIYMNAPERQIDNINGNIFEVCSRSMTFINQKDLEERLRYQNHVRSTQNFDPDACINMLEGIRQRNLIRIQQEKEARWKDIIHQVAGRENVQFQPVDYSKRELPYVTDGEWVTAKPGVDIVGIPLEQSVNKIVRMNTVTGEEEVYNPEKYADLNYIKSLEDRVERTLFTEIHEDGETVLRMSRFIKSPYSSDRRD